MTDASTSMEEQRLRSALSRLRGPCDSQVKKWRTALMLAIYFGDLTRAEATVRQATRDITAARALDQVLAPCLHDVGVLWEADEISVADEHLATTTAHRLVASVGTMLGSSQPDRGVTVLLTTPPSERHTTALLSAEVLLRHRGYRPILLGAGVPLNALAAALMRHAPHAVAISATMASAEIASTIAVVREHLPDAAILLGGAAAHRAKPLAGVTVLAGMEELLVRLERTWPGTTDPKRPDASVPPDRTAHGGTGEPVDPQGPDGAPPATDWAAAVLSNESDLDRARRALLDVGERLSGAGTLAWDVRADRIVCSEHTARMLEIGPEERSHSLDTVLGRVYPEDRGLLMEMVEPERDGAPLGEVRFRTFTTEGSTRHLHGTVAARLMRDGDPVLVIWLRDLTASRHLDAAMAAHIAAAQALQRWDDAPDAFERLLAALARALAARQATLWVPEDGLLTVRTGWDAVDAAGFQAAMSRRRLRPGQGTAGRAWTDREVTIARNTPPGPDPELRDIALRDEFAGELAIPLVCGERVIGVAAFAGLDAIDAEPRRAALTSLGLELGTFLGARRAQLLGRVPLSSREIEILQLAAEGRSGPEIARLLFLSPATVKSHFENIYTKYEVGDRVAAVAKALRDGLIR